MPVTMMAALGCLGGMVLTSPGAGLVSGSGAGWAAAVCASASDGMVRASSDEQQPPASSNARRACVE